MKVDITNRKELNELLEKATEQTNAVWGIMKSQNMIEHLATVMQYTNGKKTIAQRTTDDEARMARQALIYTDAEIPQGLKSPLLGEAADPFMFPGLEEAKKDLNDQLDDFEKYFKNNPDATCVQPRLGPLNHKEWIVFHNKHFTHHFKQFGLI